MKTIWKFKINDDTVLSIPKGAKVLSALEQFGGVCIWVLVDPSKKPEKRRFCLLETGEDIHYDSIQFIDTVSLKGGNYMAHVFEILDTPT